MLHTYPNNFTAKMLRTNISNEKDLEAHLRHTVFILVTQNQQTRKTDIYFTKEYTQSNIRVITEELIERGFTVSKFTDISSMTSPITSNPRKGLTIRY